jgi:putative glutamine amidotransferase
MKNLLKVFFVLSLCFPVLFHGCKPSEQNPLQIAVSKSSMNYENWLLQVDTSLKLINLYGLPLDSAAIVLRHCDGLLLTGGDDVFPGWYNQLADTALCEGFDPYRDSLEMMSIKIAKGLRMPVVGVCRGLQILNIEAGGSLFADLPKLHPSEISHRCQDWRNCFHQVTVDTLSQLFMLFKQKEGLVNTNHHQGIDRLGNMLLVSAWSSDSIPEAIEANPEQYSGFLIGVQWHPERLAENQNYSKPLASAFIEHAIIFRNRIETK